MARKKLTAVIFFIIYFLTRFYIFTHPAFIKGDKKHAYSDVKHDYERYANMWYYGLTPYFKHYYEYPPATIPLVLMPLIADLNGLGNYYQNYRVQILAVDIILFLLIFKTLSHLAKNKKIKKPIMYVNLMFYILATLIAKNYLYEGLDLIFAGLLVACISLLILAKQKSFFSRIFFWLFFWLSTAIKFMSIPLLAVFAFLSSLKFKKEVLASVLGFLIVWSIPLAIFHTSLSVSIVFHLKRQMKYASFPSFITETINLYTNTENRLSEPPDFPWIGPIATQVKQIFDIIFPLSVVLVVGAGIYYLYKHKKIKKASSFFNYQFALKISLIYIFTLLITGKILSAPFHIWYIPLISLFPFKNTKKQISFMLVAVWLLLISVTDLIQVRNNIKIIGPLTRQFIREIFRFLPIFIMFFFSLKLTLKEKK
jgi:hypothetical protein